MQPISHLLEGQLNHFTQYLASLNSCLDRTLVPAILNIVHLEGLECSWKSETSNAYAQYIR